MTGLLIRRAERDDAETVFRLIRALAEFERLDPPEESACVRLLEDIWGAQPKVEAWLAILDGRAAAYATSFDMYSTFLARPTLYVEDIFVLPEYRRQGIGEAFFRHLAGQAVSRGCGRMEWACLDWNEAALQFYAKLGARRLDEWVGFRLTADQMVAIANCEL